jgi:hypothetical protein
MSFTKITSDGIGDNAITSTKIAAGAVTVTDIPDGEITAAKLHTTAITDKLGYTPISPTDLSTVNNTLSTKASTGKAIAMSIVFGG